MEETENLVDRNFVTCPCCGKKTMPKLVQVDPTTIETFMSCVLAGEPFTNMYKIYNGKIKIICKQPSRAETFLLSDIATNVPSVTDDKLRMSLSNLLYYISGIFPIKEIRIVSNEMDTQDKVFDVRGLCMSVLQKLKTVPNITEQEISELKKVVADPTKVSMLPNQILSQVVNTHNTVTKNLYSAGFDNVFYTGIPHVE